MKSALSLCLLLVAAPVCGAARADDAAKYRIEFNDGVFEPRRLEVPANKKLVIEVVNKGQGPAEFESKQLGKEKVIAPGGSTTLSIRALDPGEYDFFDDFHPDAKPAVLVAK
jgi:hypothetical protein